MGNDGSSDRHLLEQAKAALRKNDQDRLAPILMEIAERGSTAAKSKVANDAT